MERKPTMKKPFATLLCCVISLTLHGAAYANPAGDCEAKAVSKDGKPLAGAAKAAFIKKCEGGSSAAQAACEAKAVSKDGKPLAGAAKASSIKKCLADSQSQ